MMDNLLTLAILPAFVSASISYLLTPFVIRFAKKVNLIDDPKKSDHPKVIHTYPIPRGGGLAIYLATAVTASVFLPADKHLIGILLGALILTIIGLLDDRFDLNPYLRLITQFLAASIPIAAGIGIAFITNPFNGLVDLSHPQINFSFFGDQKSVWLVSDFFALFWMVFLMNILNMGAKGVDGQLPGVVVIAATTIAALSAKFSADITQWPVIILAAITAGSFLGFLPWNYYPQKIMPGFSGSSLAGYLLAILSILSTTKVGTLLVVIGIPLADTGYVIIRRVLRGKSPVWGDRTHLHHKLLDAGLNKKQVALSYWLITAVLGILALNLNASHKLYTIVGTVIFVGGLLLFLYKKGQS